MIIFLYGKDTFRSRRQLKKMMLKFKEDRDPQGLNVVSLDVEKAKQGEVMQQVLAVPFLAEKRMVVIENLLISKDNDLQKEMLKRIEENSIPETNILVFWESTEKFKTKLAKEFFARLSKEKYAQGFEELAGAKLPAWISGEVKERGGEIDKDAASYMAQNVGSDTWRASSLVDQLMSYCQTKPENKIETKDIQLFLEETADDNIFNLVDAIVGKQPKKVYNMIGQQYKNGEDAHYIFAMMLRQFRILLELRDLCDRDGTAQSGALATKLGLHPFVVKKSLPLVKKYNLTELKEIYQRLLDFDIQTKTSGGDQKVLLDILVGRVCCG